MTLISENAIRELVREALETPPPYDLAVMTTDEALPVVINPSVDSSLAAVEISPVNQQFVPRDKTEFEIAVRQMTKNLPDDVIPRLYAKVREVVMDTAAKCEQPDQGDNEEMNKRVNTHLGMEESALRAQIRNVILEVLAEDEKKDDEDDDVVADLGDDEPSPPLGLAGHSHPHRVPAFRDLEDQIDSALSDSPWLASDEDADDMPSDLAAHAAEVEREEDREEFGDDPWDTSDVDAETTSDWDPEPLPAEKGRKEHEFGNQVDGDTFKRLARDLNISVAGAKRLNNMALGKLQYMLDLGPVESAALVKDAARDYIEKLVDKEHLTDKEGMVWIRHLDDGVVDELLNMGAVGKGTPKQVPSFRDFLDGVLHDEMEKDDALPYAEDPSTMKKDAAGKPIPGSGKVRHRSLWGKPVKGGKDEEE